MTASASCGRSWDFGPRVMGLIVRYYCGMTDKTVPDFGEVHVLSVDEVFPAPDNPRKISKRAVEVVAKSLREFGWQQPLVVDKDHVLIVGHTRLLAAKSLGLVRVPVVVASSLSPSQVKAYRIADNRTGDFTAWDFTALTQQLQELAGEYSDVLALTDWEAVVTEFEQIPPPLELPDEVSGYLGESFTVTVVCSNEASARRVALEVMDMDEGVIDVRDKNA